MKLSSLCKKGMQKYPKDTAILDSGYACMLLILRTLTEALKYANSVMNND